MTAVKKIEYHKIMINRRKGRKGLDFKGCLFVCDSEFLEYLVKVCDWGFINRNFIM
jgi:hypothetical protein